MNFSYLYYAALLLIALPSLPFNRVAAVVVIVWVFEQYGFLLGVPMGYGDIIGDTFGLVFGLAYSFAQTGPANRFAAIMFLPMMAVDLTRIRYGLNAPNPTPAQYTVEYECWWASFGAGMVQILALPIGNDWRRAKKTWDCYRKAKSVDWFLRVLARRHAL